MTINLSPSIVTRLEKVATDNGFDRELPPDHSWLGFGSTQAPLKIWLTAIAEDQFLVALSQANVARSLGKAADGGTLVSRPVGAYGVLVVSDIPALHRLVRRAFQLSRSLPDELLNTFQKMTAALPRSTEAERLVIQRVGQDIFRQGLIEYWEGRCAVTGLAVVPLLRASHIKPWASCSTDPERLDVFNGVLLAPNLDAVFDQGLVTIGDDGSVVLSDALSNADRITLGIDRPLRVARLEDAHRHYLHFHRGSIFRKS